MNPSECIEVKYPVVRYPGFSITHSTCLPLSLGNLEMTVVAQLCWTAWMASQRKILSVSMKSTTSLT